MKSAYPHIELNTEESIDEEELMTKTSKLNEQAMKIKTRLAKCPSHKSTPGQKDQTSTSKSTQI